MTFFLKPFPTRVKTSLLTASISLSLLALTGCAGGPAGNNAGSKYPATPGATPLVEVRPGLHTLEDSLVLDIVLGYQEAMSGGSNRETLRRARSAQNQLEYMLRHGGIKDRGAEGRVYEIPEGQKASLGELNAQMSRELLRSPTGEPEAERAREIRRHRADLGALVEDAEWVLALNAALTGPLPEEDKRNLRRLHEAYSNRAPHATVAAQVTSLLQTIKDERIRKELKKLANRSWERERRAPSSPAASANPDAAQTSSPATPETAPAAAAVAAQVSTPGADSVAPLADFDPTPVTSPAATQATAPVMPPVATPVPATQAVARQDSLSSSPATDTVAISPDRYCDDRRAAAANAFAAARAATGETRTALLHKSLAALDDCLSRYPDSRAAQKARGNRDRVQKELKAK